MASTALKRLPQQPKTHLQTPGPPSTLLVGSPLQLRSGSSLALARPRHLTRRSCPPSAPCPCRAHRPRTAPCASLGWP
eukprot:13833181-Alexandrium_andersonii.AAC.1